MTEERRLAFPPEEYAARLATVRAAMHRRDVDVLLVDEAEHLAYLTGFDRSATMYQACAVPREGEPVMVLRRLDEPAFRERTWLSGCVTFADTEDPMSVLARVLRERGWADGRLGLELDSHYLTVARSRRLAAALPDATPVDFSGVLWELRLRKSAREAPPWKMSRTPPRIKWACRPVGADNAAVYTRYLGLPPSELQALRARGVI